MQKKKKVTTIIVIVVILLSLGILAFLRIQQNSSEASRRPNIKAIVNIGKATRGEIVNVETITGDVMPLQQANIYSRVNGNLQKIFVNIGDYVNAGKLLALIDTTIYSQNEKQAHASYLQAVANLDNAKLSYDRNKSLLEQRLIAKQDVDNAKTAYDVAVSQKDAAHANWTNTITQLNYCKITAPFSGYITKRNFDAGVYVIASSTSASSTLFTLMDVEKLKVMINLPERDVPLLNNILQIKVKADAVPGEEFNAVINKISEAVDLSTRSMQIELYIDGKNKKLKPGMFISTNLILDKKENALLLNNDIIQNDQFGDYVFTITPDTVVHKQYIKTGIKNNNKVEIVSGLDDNDKIVVVGQSLVKDGKKVRLSKSKETK